MNIQSAINEGESVLKNESIPSAKLDAEILMAKSIEKDRKYIILNNNKNLDDENLRYFKNLIKERSKKKTNSLFDKQKVFLEFRIFCDN